MCHGDASLGVEELGLGARVEEEGVGAEGEGALVAGVADLRLVVRLAPCHVVVIYVQLLAAACTRMRQCTTSGIYLERQAAAPPVIRAQQDVCTKPRALTRLASVCFPKGCV